MSMTRVFRCEICHKIIEDSELNDFGYGIAIDVPGCNLIYGDLYDYEAHLCRDCIKGLGPLVDLLREREEGNEADK